MSEESFMTNYEESSIFNKNLDNLNNQNSKQLFKKEDSELVVIWGDPNQNADNNHVKKHLTSTYPFLENRIFQYTTTKEFRRQSIEKKSKNILFLMSGTFANEVVDGKSNLDWVNKNIQQNTIHSKSIILFTSKNTVNKNNWTIQNLQEKYQYVTQLTIDYPLLFKSFDKMIHNRIHRSFVHHKNLDQYFRSETNNILQIFLDPNRFTFEELRPSTVNLLDSLKEVIKYINEEEVTSPISVYIEQKQIEKFYQAFEKCFEESGSVDSKTIEKILNLYTQEKDDIYKVLNFSINTMNSVIYKHLNKIYRLFSKCLYQFQDKTKEKKLTLYRGAVIQKYQYDLLYKEYLFNKENNHPSFIVFPQFTSTSLDEGQAKSIIPQRQNQVKKESACREQNTSKFMSKENEVYLKSPLFKENYSVLINIEASFDLNDQFRPKDISSISQFKKEKEYLFQPYQSFRIKSMEQGQNEKVVSMNLSYDY